MTRRSGLLAAFAAIGLAIAGSAAAGTDNCKFVRIEEWPVLLDRNRPIVEGAINGQKIGILLDTGSARSRLDRVAAVRLGVIAFAAETRTEVAQIKEFKIGHAARNDWHVLVTDEQDFGDDAAFSLGYDFLRTVDVEFDLAHDVVRLFQAKDCEGASLAYWATDQRAGEITIESGPEIVLTVDINGKPVRAILDSGANVSVLGMPHAARLGVTPQTPGVVAAGCGIGVGKMQLNYWIGPFQSFAVGNEIIRNPQIYVADPWQMPNNLNRPPQMLLGADFLRSHRVLIAHSQRKIYFTYTGGTVFPATPLKGCNDPAK